MTRKAKTKAHQKIYIDEIKFKYCEMFGITELEYCQAEFDKAFQYLDEHQYPDFLTKSPMFWNWWKLIMAQVCEKSILQGVIQKTYLSEIQLYSSILKQCKDESFSNITQKAI